MKNLKNGPTGHREILCVLDKWKFVLAKKIKSYYAAFEKYEKLWWKNMIPRKTCLNLTKKIHVNCVFGQFPIFPILGTTMN